MDVQPRRAAADQALPEGARTGGAHRPDRHRPGGKSDGRSDPAPPPRLVRWLFRLYPRAHRERYGDEMAECIRADLARTGGGARFWAGIIFDHAGAAAAVRRRHHQAREGPMRTLREDLRNGARTLRRAPAFAALASLTLALGVGATTAAFTVLDRVVLRPLPYPDSERMALVGAAFAQEPERVGGTSAELWDALVASPGPTEALAGAGSGTAILSGDGVPERVTVSRVTDGFFAFFGAHPVVGRLLTPGDHAAGAGRVAVLGHGLWRTRFAGDPEVVGSTLVLDDVPHTVVGVLDARFMAPERLVRGDGVWTPLALGELGAGERSLDFFIRSVARLAPGASLDDLRAHLDGVLEGAYGSQVPVYVGGTAAEGLHAATVGEVGTALGRVLAAVALLFIIACVNLAGLVLARTTERSRELAVRAALGADPVRLLRHLLSEGLFLAGAAAALATLFAFLALDAFRRTSPLELPRAAEVALDAQGVAFCVVASAVAVLLCGVLPALRAALRAGRVAAPAASSPLTPARHRSRGVLVFAETTLAVVLVVGSGLLARDLTRLAGEEPGFAPEGLFALRLDLRERALDAGARQAFWDDLLRDAQSVPGVAAAALASSIPYVRPGDARGYFTPEGHPDAVVVSVRSVAGDFPAAAGVGLVEGRTLSRDDARGGAALLADGSVLVNEAFVTVYWPDAASALGRQVKMGNPGTPEPTYEVVGVLADVRLRPGEAPVPTVYRHVGAATSADLLVRAQGGAAAPALSRVRELVHARDPGLPVGGWEAAETLAAGALARPRFYAAFFTTLAVLALGLALVGVYGTTAYVTRARTREVAVRLALGATPRRVLAGVVAPAAAVLGAGIVVGLSVALLLASRTLSDVLVAVGPRDAGTYAVVAALVLGAGVGAALIPASVASRVDPASTLREEG